MDIFLLKFYLIAFHIGLMLLLFCTSIFFFIRKKSIIRLLYALVFFLLGAFRPQLYIAESTELWRLYLNALFIDLAGIIIFIAYIISIKKRLI